jgi:4-amino-4-deoxy-L-arabinose transferase-like glycosyltransferase
LALAALALAAAYRFARAEKTRAAVSATILAGLILRLWAAGDHFLHAWDERYHALVAKHLATHPLLPTLYERTLLPYDFRDWRTNHFWVHKPPLALWLMAGGLRLFGNHEIALRLPSVALSALAIGLTFGIARRLCGPRVALLAAGLSAIQGYLLQLPAGRVAVDHVDNALIVFIELAIFCAVRQALPQSREQGSTSSRTSPWLWLVAGGLATGLALLTKWLPALLPIPVWLALVAGRRRPAKIILGLAVQVACAALVALPYQLYIRRTFPLESSWESFYNFRHLFVPVEGLGGPPWFHLVRMARYFGELIYLPLIWLLVGLFRSSRPALDSARPMPPDAARERSAWAALAVWCLAPYLVFSLAATKLGGYPMIAAPGLCILEACFWFWVWDFLQREREKRALRIVASALLVLLLALPIRYTVERMKVRSGYDRDPVWAEALRALPSQLGPGPLVLFNVQRPIEAMFYTPYIVYSGIPTPAIAAALLAAGNRVVVLGAGPLTASLAGVPGIELRTENIPPGPTDDGTGFQPRRADLSDSPLAGMDNFP